MVGSCEHGNEHSCSTIEGNFLTELAVINFLSKNSARQVNKINNLEFHLLSDIHNFLCHGVSQK